MLLAGCATADPAPTSSPTQAAPSATPSPTPSQTKPALDELVLSPEGLGSVVIGEAPPTIDPAIDVVIFDVDYCQADVDAGLIEDAGKWIPNYEPALSGPSREPFSVHVNGTVNTISIASDQIRTSEGLGLGSTIDDVRTAYPEGVEQQGHETNLFIVPGVNGQLVFEVLAADSTDPYYGPDGAPAGTVVFVRVHPAGQELRPWASTDNGFAMCTSV